MRKKLTFLAIILVASQAVISQKISLCQAFEKIQTASQNSFSDFNNGVKESSLVKSYFSKLEIAEATETILQDNSWGKDFIAKYGEFETESEAQRKVEELTKSFTSCFPVCSFSNYYEKTIYPIQKFNFILNTEGGFRYYDACFRISYLGKKYNVEFFFPSAERRDYSMDGFLDSKTLIVAIYTDYFYLKSTADNQPFSVDLRKVIAESKTGFKAFRGTDIMASFNVSGYELCYLEDENQILDFHYVIPVALKGSVELVGKLKNEVAQKLIGALGSEYAVNESPDGMFAKFVYKNRPHHEVVSLMVTDKGAGKYNLMIKVNADMPKK